MKLRKSSFARHVLLISLSLLPFPLVATPQEEIATQVPAARAILDAWQAKNPERAERKLQIVLWTPADREPAPRHRERLSAALFDIRDFYAGEMKRLGFGPRTLRFDHAADGLINIHLVRGRGPHADYKRDSGNAIRSECQPQLRAAGIDPDRETIVIFCNMATWDPKQSTISQNSPYYAGGSHRNGTAWQVDSPILDLALLEKKEPLVQDGDYGKISVGRYNSIFIGGICHELGHALGLPHCREREDENKHFGTSLMGSGNRSYREDRRDEGKGSFLPLADGLRLASHPVFCGSVKGIDLPATAIPADLAIRREGEGFVFSGTVTADPPVYGVVAYMDPEGGGDYDATSTSAVPDAEGRFALDCQALASGKKAELRVVFLQANGVASGFLNPTPFRYPYSVDCDGSADISLIKSRLTLAPVADALKQNNKALAKTLLARPALRNDAKLLAIAKRLIESDEVRRPPSQTIRSLALSDLPPANAKVGYGKATRDRLPEDSPLLISGGKLFTHGFYAHAPARHEWQLDGSWKSLEGFAGIADGKDGSVRFTVEVDGRQQWQSPVIGSGKLELFRIDLTGAKSLVLLTDEAEGGRDNDWGLWLDPVISR
ncbi:NPCBM/NEW2 domain-containing protein [Luteolibacter arcticus]|uniref:NPCBM/NEW2 domain-containing protein n=1 Tax=Luteolibacter arcticus TaxID=1581411 RepID=A0ABT3GNC2_9BACT|nr:NPCBM/NEW2 domain-containing protein [Luteolibacter arcticus]MCW1925009.1 NPCBM/NEW2 domain-containing protein [Luteolibacter arcticus]